MLRLKDENGIWHPVSDYEDFHITHKQNGSDTMSFTLNTAHEQYPLLQEETVIQTDQNEYLIKKIDDDKIDCELNFDFLKERAYYDYISETRSLTEVLLDHLPSGWTIEGANVSTIRRTISFDTCNDYDVVMQCIDTYAVYFVWHILEKRLVVVDPETMQPTGEYITSELNLRSLSFRGQTADFATRLYAYGKDGMTMETAILEDGTAYGKTYVDDNSFSAKVICATWKDERYTVPENLLADAKKKLKSMAWPVRSYECKVDDLAKQDSRYSFLDFAMHKVITLLDVDRHIAVNHQIVEYDEWPDEPSENSITLSSVAGTIQNSVKQLASEAETAAETVRVDLSKSIDEVKTNSELAIEEAKKEMGENGQKISDDMTARINMASAMLTAAFGSYTYTKDGELYIMDNENPSLAQVVWRWNVNGFGKSSTGIDGPYTTSLTVDDSFVTNIISAMVIRGSYIEAASISADKISQAYTDDTLSQAFTAAKGLVEAMYTELDTYLNGEDGQLTVLSKNIADIRSTIDGLNLDFSEAFRGGINYVANSSGLNGLSDDWEITGGTVVTLQSADTKNTTVANSCFRLSTGAKLTQTIDNALLGEPYTISARVRKDGDLLSEVYVIYNGDTVGKLFSSSETANWDKYEITIDGIQSNTLQFVAETRSDYLYVADIMVCEGTTAKAWTPAPDEIYTSGVSIDKRGIEVYRSDTDEVTRINNKEFAGYYNDEEVFSLNKDETRINKAIVRGELRIEDVKFIPYENGEEKGLNIAIID